MVIVILIAPIAVSTEELRDGKRERERRVASVVSATYGKGVSSCPSTQHSSYHGDNNITFILRRMTMMGPIKYDNKRQ